MLPSDVYVDQDGHNEEATTFHVLFIFTIYICSDK